MTELLSAAHPRLSIRTVRSFRLRRLIAKNLSRLRFQRTSSSRFEAEWPYSTIAGQTCTDRGKIAWKKSAVAGATIRSSVSWDRNNFGCARRRVALAADAENRRVGQKFTLEMRAGRVFSPHRT